MGKSSTVTVGSAVVCSAEEGCNGFVTEEFEVCFVVDYFGWLFVVCPATICSGCSATVCFIDCLAVDCSEGLALDEVGIVVA